jgi:hypothetical protein
MKIIFSSLVVIEIFLHIRTRSILTHCLLSLSVFLTSSFLLFEQKKKWQETDICLLLIIRRRQRNVNKASLIYIYRFFLLVIVVYLINMLNRNHNSGNECTENKIILRHVRRDFVIELVYRRV